MHTGSPEPPRAERPPEVQDVPPRSGTHLPYSRPVIPVATVALRLHKAVRMMEDFPAGACDDAWLRVHGTLSSFRSEMLWLNENAHLAPTDTSVDVDVSEALRRLRVNAKAKGRPLRGEHKASGGSCAERGSGEPKKASAPRPALLPAKFKLAICHMECMASGRHAF